MIGSPSPIDARSADDARSPLDAGAAAAAACGPRVALLPELSFIERNIEGRRTYVCHHRQKGQFFHFGADEYHAAMLLDGTRGVAEVVRRLQQQGTAWSAGDVAQWLAALVQQGLAYVVEAGCSGEGSHRRPADRSGDGPQGGAVAKGGPAAPGGAGVWGAARYLAPLLSQRLNLLDGDRLAERGVAWWGPLFSLRGVLLWMAVVLSGLGIVVVHQEAFTAELQRLFAPQSWLLWGLLWCLVKMAHEAGHAIAARRQGVQVGRAGVILFLLAPLPFVDVTDAWRLPRRWSRIQIALAGMYVELGIAGLAAWFWWWAEGEFARHVAVQLVMLAGPATLVVNANPLLRLDGYYVLSDLLEIPNLRMHGRQRLLALLEGWLFGCSVPNGQCDPPGCSGAPGLLGGWRARVAVVHAVGSVLFQFLWMAGLVISVSLWAGGLGVLLGAVAVLLWGILPFAQWVGRIRRDADWAASRPRVLALGAAVCLGIGLLAALPSPLGRRVPVVVQYRDQQLARAACDGFVVEVPVRNGQRVEAGELLIVLDDPELRVQRDQLALEVEASQLRSRRLSRDGRQALAAAEHERHLGLLRSLEELERQVQSLRICADRGGVVCSPRPERWLGRFAHRGDLLLCVAEETSKELLASVDGADLDAYLQAVERGEPCSVRLRGGADFEVVPARPRPRVGQTIPHPALAVTAGGPLAVEPQPAERLSSAAPGEAYRLIAPRSESRSPLSEPVSQRLRSGQQGMLILGDSRSLVGRTVDALRQLVAS